MKRTLTRNDVILFSFLGTDCFTEQYSDNKFLNIEENLPDELKPGKNIMNNIINYSKALRLIKTKAIKNVHVILN